MRACVRLVGACRVSLEKRRWPAIVSPGSRESARPVMSLPLTDTSAVAHRDVAACPGVTMPGNGADAEFAAARATN